MYQTEYQNYTLGYLTLIHLLLDWHDDPTQQLLRYLAAGATRLWPRQRLLRRGCRAQLLGDPPKHPILPSRGRKSERRERRMARLVLQQKRERPPQRAYYQDGVSTST